MPSRQDKLLVSMRWLTVWLAVSVAAFVPAMQILLDHTWPKLTKPVCVGFGIGCGIGALFLLPMRWHLRALLMCLAGMMTLGLLEVANLLITGIPSVSLYMWDDHCLYRLRPGASKTFVRTALNGGQRISVAVNSVGFRGPELTSDKSHSRTLVRRVVVYGDSFVEAEYSRLEDTFVEQLRVNLAREIDGDVEAINAGVIGYGPDQMLLRMEADLPQLRPDAVVVCFFADNDLGDLLRNKLFRLNEAGDLIPHSWKIAPDCGHPGTRPPYEPALWKWARNAVRALQSQSSSTESYMDRWLAQCTAEYKDYVIHQDPFVRELQVDHYDADVSLTPGAESARYKIKLFRKILERMKADCRTHKVPLSIVIIPSPADLIPDYDFCSVDRSRYPDYDPQALTSAMAAAAKDLDILHLDLYEPFRLREPRSLYFRGGDNHWNDKGQREAALLVAPQVARQLQSSRSD